MKRVSIAGLGALAVVASVPFVAEMPVLANLQNVSVAIAQNIKPKTQVHLKLGAQKKFVQQDQQGKQQITWQSLQGRVVVQPGDVIRYVVSGENTSDRPVKNLAITQPIPLQTTYVLNSASANNKATKITYSIDNGKSFVEKPIVQVKLANGKVETKPAPAELYTQVRWQFREAIDSKTALKATYQVQVR